MFSYEVASEEYLKALDAIQKSGSESEVQGTSSSSSPPNSSSSLGSSKGASAVVIQFIINQVRSMGVAGGRDYSRPGGSY